MLTTFIVDNKGKVFGYNSNERKINLQFSVWLPYLYRMDTKPKRKEVHLSEFTIKRLAEKANVKKWSLKQYMEEVLVRAAKTKEILKDE